MKSLVNKQVLGVVGKAGLKLGKAIVIEGTKAMLLKTCATVIATGYENGVASIKNIKFDDIVDTGYDGKKKKKFLGKKKKVVNEQVEVELELDVEVEELKALEQSEAN